MGALGTNGLSGKHCTVNKFSFKYLCNKFEHICTIYVFTKEIFERNFCACVAIELISQGPFEIAAYMKMGLLEGERRVFWWAYFLGEIGKLKNLAFLRQ